MRNFLAPENSPEQRSSTEMYILDTNVISELGKAHPHPNVLRWAEAHPLNEFYLSAIGVKELEYGCLLMEWRDQRQGSRLRQWLSVVFKEYEDRILVIDRLVAQKAASLHVPDPAPEADAYIAATALVTGFSVVTRNVTDFVRFAGLTIINPWEDLDD